MIEFWNERYSAESYAYGTEPNEFFKTALTEYNLKGKILFPAEGEGRNAVYAAEQGIEAYAFDTSSEGKKKAFDLALKKNVELNYQTGALEDLFFENNFFDAVVLIYAHFPPNRRANIHEELAKLVKPNGLVILEGFSVNNLSYRDENPSIGGPDKKELLYTMDLIREDFKDFEVLQLEEVETELNEGMYHQGKGSVVRFVGRKRTPKKMNDTCGIDRENNPCGDASEY